MSLSFGSPTGRPRRLVGLLTAVTAVSLAVPAAALAAPSLPAGPTPGAAGIGDRYYPTDGNGGYDVADYRLALEYDPAGRDLKGTALVTATASQALSSFNLDLLGFTVRSVKVQGQPAKAFVREGKNELVITPARPLNRGARFVAEVSYEGTPGRAWRYNGDGGGAFVLGQPRGGMSWFPNNDHPRDRATFALDITVPKGWTAISIGTELPPRTDGAKTTFRWRERKEVITYATTVAIDKFTVVRSKLADGRPVIDAYAPGTEAGARPVEQRLPEVLDFLASMYGPYPHSSTGGVFVAGGPGAALEIQTRPVYTKDFGTKPPAWVVVHEQAHQWYGDLVSVRNWADLCLNECFASYAQWQWEEAKEKVVLDDKYRAQIAERRGKPEFWANKLTDPGADTVFNGHYDKGPLALHALRREIGEAAFKRLLRTWPAQHRNGHATWSQFEALVKRLAPGDKARLDAFLAAWFHADRLPADTYLWPGKLKPATAAARIGRVGAEPRCVHCAAR